MKPPPFPNIPGVEFLLLPHGYAIASNRTVWDGRSGKWRKMTTYINDVGKDSVRHQFTDTLGGAVWEVDDLMERFEK